MMDTSVKVLDLLFRRVSPERILNELRKEGRHLSGSFNAKKRQELFLHFAETTLWGYSENEQELICQYLRQSTEKLAEASGLCSVGSAFLPIAGFTLETLTMMGDEPVCRYSEVLRWRDAYLLLGQDQLVCAFLAYKDIEDLRTRQFFAWPATIRTDHNVLYQLLEDGGIAENHRHMNGSTQSFELSWCVLMNHPADSETMPEVFRASLQTMTSRGADDNMLPLKERIQLAALIRALLFERLHERDFSFRSTNVREWDRGYVESHINTLECNDHYQTASEFKKAYLDAFLPLQHLAGRVDVLRQRYGARVPNPGGVSVLDYALEKDVFSACEKTHYRVLAGERSFLYHCFSKGFCGAFSPFEQSMFYLYLLLKTAFRSELIQVNKQVGFQNFKNYEARKDLVWENCPHRWEAYRMALNGVLEYQNVVSLESRVTPATTAEKMREKIEKIDIGKQYADISMRKNACMLPFRWIPELQARYYSNEPYFFVVHFVKERDDPPTEEGFLLKCRHEKLRRIVKTQAMTLANALSRSSYLCSRIRGIDACSNEVICRPEVFANAFRFLHNDQSSAPQRYQSLLPQPLRGLSQTYHAGEDFYDIADGLRAIDEAIRFLAFRRGDRIGHALALGVEPAIHYATKFRVVVLPKQNYLDNLVWMVCRGYELRAGIDLGTIHLMRIEAERLLGEIYGDAMREHGWTISIEEYYNSMLLRGDSPERYKSMRFSPNQFCIDPYKRFSTCDSIPNLPSFRSNEKVAGLYYYYHYGEKEKSKGAEVITVKISNEYITAIRAMQDAMQNWIEREGIIIECNLSSNVLIGTFGEYKDHPIFRFYDLRMEQGGMERQPRMHVCINTDDLGIFDTSLEFEYALLAQALHERGNENDSPIADIAVQQYLRDIQSMGRQAVFPKPLPSMW